MHAIVLSCKYDDMLLHKGDSVLIYLSASILSAPKAFILLLGPRSPPRICILAYWRLKPLVRSRERIHNPTHARAAPRSHPPSDSQA
jgi:hypothetical protein